MKNDRRLVARTWRAGLLAVLAALLVGSAPAAAVPPLSWVAGIGTTTIDGGHDLAVDALGDVYVTGFFTGTADFDPGPGTFNLTSAGSRDVFVLKLDDGGGLLWAVCIGASQFDDGTALALDPGRNVYVTGSFTGTVDFDPGPGISSLSSAGGRDIFVLKLDREGSLVWAARVGGLGASDRGEGIAVDGGGNVYVTGFFGASGDFDPGPGTFNLSSAGGEDLFVLKLDSSGGFLWAVRAGAAGRDVAASVSVDASGSAHVIGSFQATVDFDPGPGAFDLTAVGSEDIFVQKLDPSGDLAWAVRMGSAAIGLDDGRDIAVDGAGNVHTTGVFAGTVDFDPGPATFNIAAAGGSEDIFVQKLDSGGGFLWAVGMGSTQPDPESGLGVAVDGAGDVYTTGIFSGTVDFDPGPGTFELTSAGGFWDIFIQKLDGTGSFLWAARMGGAGDDRGRSIALSGWGGVYTTGSFSGTVDFDPGPGAVQLTSAGDEDIFVQQLGAAAQPIPTLGSLSLALLILGLALVGVAALAQSRTGVA